jgi:hypothetical protein
MPAFADFRQSSLDALMEIIPAMGNLTRVFDLASQLLLEQGDPDATFTLDDQKTFREWALE